MNPTMTATTSTTTPQGRDWQCPDCGEVFTIVPGWRKLPDVACKACRRRLNGYQWTAIVLFILACIGNIIGGDAKSEGGVGILGLFLFGSMVKVIRHGSFRYGGFVDGKR